MSTDAEILERLDFTEIACQCEQHLCRGKCPRPATLRITFHALDHCDNKADPDINEYGNYTFLLCLHCLKALSVVVAQHIAALNLIGRPQCQTCGAPVHSTQPDVIREVVTL